MRQEKTMKIIANHFIDPRITITPHAGSDKSWVWVAYDFAEYELVEKVCVRIVDMIYLCWGCIGYQTFAIRFGSPEIAQEFKKLFLEQQAANKKFVEGLDSEEGQKEAEEIATAIDNLAVSSSETPKDSSEEVAKPEEPSEST